jgi:integrating conjugative element protein (TIGR03761 family)
MNADNPIAHPNAKNADERPRPPSTPGALHGQVWLTIQTNQAQQLIHGRAGTPDKPTIIGLVGFANRLRVIWQAARNDDPYADWWLIKVHEVIEVTRTYLGHQQADLVKQLEQMPAMEVSIAASQRPCRVHLQFANPYAYRGAQLLAEFDRLVCTALTARHIGLMDGKAYVHVQQTCARKLRALFMLPQNYRLLKIDRESVRRQTGRSHEARQIMGEIPDDILSGERQAPLVPRKVKFPAGFAGHVKLHPGSTDTETHLSEDKNDDG